MSSPLWNVLVPRWPLVAGQRRGRRFWGVASGAALAASAALVGALDALWSAPPSPRAATASALRIPGFTGTRGSGFLAHGGMFALHLMPEGARLLPDCPAGRCRPLQLRLVGARADMRLHPQDPLPGRARTAASGWLGTRARLFASVLYEDAYPGIGLRFRGQGDDFSYAFLIDRGASPRSIVLELDGVDHVAETPGGGLVASASGGAALALPAPSAQQDGPVDAWYIVRSRRQVTLDVGLYDVRRPLAVWSGRADLSCPHR